MTKADRRPTLVDVARLAGTSTAVVSYVLNGGPRSVAEPTRVKVEAAIKALGYRRNPLAGGLSAGRTNLIGLLVPDSSNAFFSELSRHFELEGHRRGFLTLLGNTNYDAETEAEYFQAFSDLRVAGTIVASIGDHPPDDHDSPRIYVHSPAPGATGACVRFDDYGGAVAAVEHLLEHGYDRIDCITGREGRGPAADRARGWQDTVMAGSRAAGEIVHVSFNRIEAEREIQAAWEENGVPRSVFATTDELAFAAVHAAADLGRRVPADIAVIGFDGIREALHRRPPLTTVAAPIRMLAHRALDALEAWDDWGSTVTQSLDTSITVGSTCGCR